MKCECDKPIPSSNCGLPLLWGKLAPNCTPVDATFAKFWNVALRNQEISHANLDITCLEHGNEYESNANSILRRGHDKRDR
jgi:hypothetical protein